MKNQKGKLLVGSLVLALGLSVLGPNEAFAQDTNTQIELAAQEAKVEELRKQIVDGEIEVPQNEEEFKSMGYED